VITQSVIDWFRDVIVTLLEVVNPSLGTEAGGLAGGLDSFFAAIGSHVAIMDPFVPVASVGIAVAQAVSVIGFLLLVWIGRFVVSLATGGGGSA
jgi:hypothetical protein